jgi:hypothetical protein
VLVPSTYERSKAFALGSWVKGTNTSTSPYIKTEGIQSWGWPRCIHLNIEDLITKRFPSP